MFPPKFGRSSYHCPACIPLPGSWCPDEEIKRLISLISQGNREWIFNVKIDLRCLEYSGGQIPISSRKQAYKCLYWPVGSWGDGMSSGRQDNDKGEKKVIKDLRLSSRHTLLLYFILYQLRGMALPPNIPQTKQLQPAYLEDPKS